MTKQLRYPQHSLIINQKHRKFQDNPKYSYIIYKNNIKLKLFFEQYISAIINMISYHTLF